MKALEHADSSNVLLNEGGDSALGLLARVALLVDVGRNEIHPHRQEGKREQGKPSQHRVDAVHDPYHKAHQKGQVQRVHDGRAQVHAHMADIFADSVHQIPSVVRLVEGRVQALVMLVDFFFQVVFHQSTHHDDGLPGQERKEPLDQVGKQEKHGLQKAHPNHKIQDVLFAVGNGAGHGLEPGQVPEDKKVLGQTKFRCAPNHGGGVLFNRHQKIRIGIVKCIDAFPNHGGRPNRKHVGEHHEDHAEEHAPGLEERVLEALLLAARADAAHRQQDFGAERAGRAGDERADEDEHFGEAAGDVGGHLCAPWFCGFPACAVRLSVAAETSRSGLDDAFASL